MIAEIISIGNELLSGNTVNSNASYMSKRLHEIGIQTGYIQTIGDTEKVIHQALQLALTRSDVVLITGGLGPTHDDITKKVIANYFEKKLVLFPEILKEVEEKFRKRGIPMPEINRNQAVLPEDTELMLNKVGSARGMIFEKRKKLTFVMPGVPREMQQMMDDSVVPRLMKEYPDCRFKVDIFRTTGIPESAIYEKLEEQLQKFFSYEIAFLPKFTGVDLRVVRKGDDLLNESKFHKFKKSLQQHIGDFVYSFDERELEVVIGELLRTRKLTLSVAESLTGGLIQSKITDVSGSSIYFMGGVVAYSNEAKKELLGVQQTSLEEFGAVSGVVAREMAQGVRERFHTNIGLSTTGIAGPTGETPNKPIGLVYIGISTKNNLIAKEFKFGNDREINKQRSAQAALDMIRRNVLGLSI